MPREAPNLPRDTHARLLAGRGANGHMPVVGHEVATFPRRSLARKLGVVGNQGRQIRQRQFCPNRGVVEKRLAELRAASGSGN